MERHSIIKLAHLKKVKTICIHQRKDLIYSLGEDKRISVTEIGSMDSNYLAHIKCSNFTPKTMVLHQDLNRLFVSMKERVLMVFDISEAIPIILQTMVLPNYFQRISIDTSINQL